MFEITILSLRVRFSMAANRLIYFLRNLPILKRILPPSLHGEYVLKIILSIFGALFIASKRSFLHLLTMGIAVAVGATQLFVSLNGGLFNFSLPDDLFAGFTASGVIHYSLLTWIIVTTLGFFTQTRIADVGLNYKNDDIMINYLNADPTVYAKSRLLLDLIARVLLYAPYFLVAFLLAGIPVWGVLTALLIMVSFRLLGEVTNLAMAKRYGMHFGQGAHANIAGVLVIVAALLLPLFLSAAIATLFIPLFVAFSDISAIFANPLVLLVCAGLAVLSWLYLMGYQNYRNVLRDSIKFYIDHMNKHAGAQQSGAMAAEMASAQKWAKNVSEADLDSSKFSHKSGFAYLNAIFFDRHSKFFRRKLSIRCAIIALAPIAIIAAVLIVGLVDGTFAIGDSIRDFLGFEDEFLSGLFANVPIFFFIIYIASMGRIVTASVFSNCDIQMLHYSYYRTRENIFSSFKARITEILRFNFLITTVMSMGVIFAVGIIFGYFDLLYSSVFFLVLTAIGVLFAFNDLFLYYVIQPYDEAGTGKSTVYKIINFAIYVVAWINFQNQFEFFTYAAIIGVVTVAYIGIGLVLLLSLAPRRFKLR
ncbi:MAG: hypothetical protein FWC13_08055 [Oscillospiraceae bacterium]|nr:hypothetical protein [Oscillospiraceae bacterium]